MFRTLTVELIFNMQTSEQTKLASQLNAGAKSITNELVKLLNKQQIPFREITWKNGKEGYILSVKTEYGTRFCRMTPISLLDQKDPMTQQVNSFLFSKLVEKLASLKNKDKQK